MILIKAKKILEWRVLAILADVVDPQSANRNALKISSYIYKIIRDLPVEV